MIVRITLFIDNINYYIFIIRGRRVLLKLKENHGLCKLYAAGSLSVMGDLFYYIALITYASTLPNSALAISLITTLEYIPPIFSIWVGRLSDKIVNKTRIEMWACWLQCVLYILNGILFLAVSNWTLLIACLVINFISDTIGLIPLDVEPAILNRLSPHIEFEKKFGLSTSIIEISSVIGKFLGGVVITFMSNQYTLVSWINAGTFGLAALLIISIGNVKVDNKDDEGVQKFNVYSFIREHLIIKYLIFILTSISFVLAPISSIIYILLSKGSLYSPLGYAASVSVLTTVDSIASILGPTLGLKLFKGSKVLSNYIILYSVFTVIFISSVFLNNFYIVVLTLFSCSFISGASTPVIYGKLVAGVPEAKLGSIYGFVDTVLSITPPIATFLFSSSLQYLNAFWVILILTIFSLMIMVIILTNRRKLCSEG